jgi:hypothetical protein
MQLFATFLIPVLFFLEQFFLFSGYYSHIAGLSGAVICNKNLKISTPRKSADLSDFMLHLELNRFAEFFQSFV